MVHMFRGGFRLPSSFLEYPLIQIKEAHSTPKTLLFQLTVVKEAEDLGGRAICRQPHGRKRSLLIKGHIEYISYIMSQMS